jgi:hypothetical protein
MITLCSVDVSTFDRLHPPFLRVKKSKFIRKFRNALTRIKHTPTGTVDYVEWALNYTEMVSQYYAKCISNVRLGGIYVSYII